MRERTIHAGFGRTALTGGLAVAAVLATFVAAGPGHPVTAGAAPATPAAPAAPAQTPYIDTGQASARANVISIAPSAGALQLALGGGNTIAETIGGLAQASAQAANLGLIGSALTADDCRGDAGPLEPDQVPHALVVDNRGGASSASSDELPTGLPGVAAGSKRVEAGDGPASRAVVTSIGADASPLISVNGGEATSEAEVFPGEGREARANVTVDVTILGTVTLQGLRWTAAHRTGGGDHAEAAFEIGALQVLGVPIPVESVEQAVAAANQALLPLGLRLEAPRVERITEPVDLVRVTPLRLIVDESIVSEVVVRPALQASQAIRSQLFDAVVQVICDAAGAMLVAEIGVGLAAGSGSLITSIGGAEASSQDLVIEDLFATIGGGGLGPVDTPVLGGSSPAVASGSPARSATSSAPAVVPGATGVATQPVAAAGVFDQVCESTHPNRTPDCSEGAAATVGVVGLAATALVGALDWRRRRRLITVATEETM